MPVYVYKRKSSKGLGQRFEGVVPNMLVASPTELWWYASVCLEKEELMFSFFLVLIGAKGPP